jgi:glycosyltransferase involved in cell wall biosynthesis
MPGANWQATIHHGLPRDLHTFHSKPGSYLAFLGRISPEKRLDRAIAIALRAGMKLKVAAKIYPEERAYYQESIEPLLRKFRSSIEFIGEVGGRQKAEFLGNAQALLFPIDWPEPFGLVMIEAMACGTPVIAWRNGSVPEVIEHGVTGFVVDNVDDAVQAVQRIEKLSRRVCRKEFERRFDARRMAVEYLNLYHRLAYSAGQAISPVVNGARAAAFVGPAPAHS